MSSMPEPIMDQSHKNEHNQIHGVNFEDTQSIVREEIVYVEEIDADRRAFQSIDLLASISIQASREGCVKPTVMMNSEASTSSSIEPNTTQILPHLRLYSNDDDTSQEVLHKSDQNLERISPQNDIVCHERMICSPDEEEKLPSEEDAKFACLQNGEIRDSNNYDSNFYEGPKDIYDAKKEMRDKFEAQQVEISKSNSHRENSAPLMVHSRRSSPSKRKTRHPGRIIAASGHSISPAKLVCVRDPESLAAILETPENNLESPHQPPIDGHGYDSSSSSISDEEASNILEEFGIKLACRPQSDRHVKPLDAEKVLLSTTTSTDCTYFRGTMYQKGDIVALVDVDDDCFYFAQINCILQDQLCEKSASLDWLVPTRPTSRDHFDPTSYKIGFRDDRPRKLECMSFVCHAPYDYYTRAKQLDNLESPESSGSCELTSINYKTDQSFIWTSMRVCEISRPQKIHIECNP